MAQQVVAIFSQESGAQRFTEAAMMRLQVTPSSKMPEHPLENGASVVDHRIILPTEANLAIFMTGQNYASIYQQVQTSFGSGELLRLQTYAGTFENMVLQAIPFEETPDALASVAMMVQLKEVKFFATQYTAAAVRNPSNSRARDTTRRGEQNAKPRDSVAYQLFGK